MNEIAIWALGNPAYLPLKPMRLIYWSRGQRAAMLYLTNFPGALKGEHELVMSVFIANAKMESYCKK